MIFTSFSRYDINQATSKISEKLLYQRATFSRQEEVILIRTLLWANISPNILPERLLVQLWDNKGGIQDPRSNNRICDLNTISKSK